MLAAGQNLFVGTHGFLANGEHYKTVRRNMGNGMVEEFLVRMFDIASGLDAFSKGSMQIMV